MKHLRALLILSMVLGMVSFMLPGGVFAQAPTPTMEVSVDIKPGSCPNPVNVKSRGVLPVAILGTESFRVADIDPTTIRLFFVKIDGETVDLEAFPVLPPRIEDVATPYIPTADEELTCESCHELEEDGFDDLTLKFRTQDVIKAIEAVFKEDTGGGVPDGTCIAIVLEGLLKDGTSFVGQDVVRILKRGRGFMPNIPNRPNRPPFPNFPVQ